MPWEDYIHAYQKIQIKHHIHNTIKHNLHLCPDTHPHKHTSMVDTINTHDYTCACIHKTQRHTTTHIHVHIIHSLIKSKKQLWWESGVSPLVEDPWGLAHFHIHTFSSMMLHQGTPVCLLSKPSTSSLLCMGALTFHIRIVCLRNLWKVHQLHQTMI